MWNLYRFDRRLRFLILDAVERIEIALRTRIAYHWAEFTSAKGISNPQKFDRFYRRNYRKNTLILDLQKRYEHTADDCFIHHRNHLGIDSVLELPVWVFVELAMFGQLFLLLKDGLRESVKYAVAASFGFEHTDFDSFISSLALIKEARNCCAHHARVWNRRWILFGDPARQPIAPEIKFPCGLCAQFSEKTHSWTIPPTYAGMSFDRTTTLSLLAFCSFFTEKIAPQSCWRERVVSLFDELSPPENLQAQAGVVSGWREHPLFSIAGNGTGNAETA